MRIRTFAVLLIIAVVASIFPGSPAKAPEIPRLREIAYIAAIAQYLQDMPPLIDALGEKLLPVFANPVLQQSARWHRELQRAVD